MKLRVLRWWDIAGIVPLERELFTEDPWTAEAFWAELALGSARSYVVAEGPDGALLGYAGLSCPSPARGADAEVMTLAVAPSAQGAGVGRSLLEALRVTAVERGAGRLLLEVRADNAAARALYTAAGFEQVATRPAYYRTTSPDRSDAAAVDALVLRLHLVGGATDPDSVPP